MVVLCEVDMQDIYRILDAHEIFSTLGHNKV